MVDEQNDSEPADKAGAAAAGVPLRHRTVRAEPAGLAACGEFPEAADRVADDGPGTPQLPGLERY
jgi:hypothetical protein